MLNLIKQIKHTDCLLACLAMVLKHENTVAVCSLIGKDPDKDDIEVADIMRVLAEIHRPAICITATSVYVKPTIAIALEAEPMIRRHLEFHIRHGGAAIACVPAQEDPLQGHAVVICGDRVLDPATRNGYTTLDGLTIHAIILLDVLNG